MGVFGLWRLLDATGKPVPLETLEGKVLAVDVSIWIHQVLQGYQDRHGNPKPNAHLLGLYHRICKLLYFKIKPVFVFDGGVPMLKKNTIASRRKQKSIAASKAQKMKADLITNLIKHRAVKTVLNPDGVNGSNDPSQILSQVSSQPVANDMFILPSLPSTSQIEFTDSEDSDSSVHVSPRKQSKWMGNIHSVDVSSSEFKSLPADVRYDILTDLKETRKQNSWGRLHEMPEESNSFSGFQMKRLLKRRFVQESLESAEKEMGGKTLTLEELEKLLTEEGIRTNDRQDDIYRIAADSTTRLIYISDKNALPKNNSDVTDSEEKDTETSVDKDAEPVAGPSKLTAIVEDINEYQLSNDDWDSDVELLDTSDPILKNVPQFQKESDSDLDDFESDSEINQSHHLSKKYFGKKSLNPALTYMLEYSGLTQRQILMLLQQTKADKANKAKMNGSDIKNEIKVEPGSPKASCETVDLTEDAATSDIVNEIVPVKTLSETVIEAEETLQNSEVVEKAVNETIIPSGLPDEKNVSTSDSDSDDFIEIPDVPIPSIKPERKNVSKPGLQITIRSDMKPEDDLFANVFDTSNNDLTSPPSVELNDDVDIDVSIESDLSFQTEKDLKKKSEKPEELEQQVPTAEITIKPGVADVGNRKLEISAVVNIEKDLPEREPEVIEVNEQDTRVGSIDKNDAQKLESWLDDIKNASPAPPPMTEEELISLRSQLEDEQEDLTANIGKLERQANGVTDQIRSEAQELLQLFGIPYIVAPMEAEAQCAFLEQIRLTDGTITDDSDIWLFGGKCVYKNFFNNNKRVLRYRSCDIQHHFKLTRREMIQLALLVGSDYTQGVTGIGPVTALEILAAFPTEGENLLNGLASFSAWVKSGKVPGPGKTSLRTKLKNVQIQQGFPSQAVVQAYLFPTVNESKEGFTWGKPNLVLLSDYTRKKFGWTKAKFEEQIKLVLKKLDENKSQKGIDSYFQVKESPKSIEPSLSKRVLKAVKRLNNEEESEDESVAEKPKKKGRGKSKANAIEEPQEKEVADVINEIAEQKPELLNITACNKQDVHEYIPQREKDKAAAFERKLRAIEVLRKSKKGLNKTRKVKRSTRKVKEHAQLSESDSSST